MGRHVAGLGGTVCVGGVHVRCVMLQRSALATRLAVAVVDRALSAALSEPVAM